MSRYRTTADLPSRIPVFPLAGALLLPRTDLPLNIFEPRYLAMIERAMKGDQLIGMIQPVPGDERAKPDLARVGCLGRITSYAETEGDRLLITLSGVCRFVVRKEFKVASPFRQVEVDYDGFSFDLVGDSQSRTVDRQAVIKAFRQYLEANNMGANWQEVDQVPTELLINTLSQLAPYPAPEKQALLEASNLQARADMLIALTELALSGGPDRAKLQ